MLSSFRGPQIKNDAVSESMYDRTGGAVEPRRVSLPGNVVLRLNYTVEL
jgi:hypothetical protein